LAVSFTCRSPRPPEKNNTASGKRQTVMAFLLYQTSTSESRGLLYQKIGEVKLAGDGLIYSTCKKFLGNQNVGWTITASDMLTASGYDPNKHALIIDAAPNRKEYVLFMQIRTISGYSYSEWTPLMLTLESLFADEFEDARAQEIKTEFEDRECPRDRVREFLYLLGGYASGKWNWGGNSRTTAALLWDDAWAYFATSISPPAP
jgi:hypothetical protein